MLLEIYDIEPLKNFLDVVFDSGLQDIELKIDPEKLSINLLNSGHIAFYNLELTKNFFDTFEVEPTSLILDMEDFYKLIKSSNKNDTLTLKSNEGYLYCIFENENSRRVFELPLIDTEYTSPVPPSINYQYKFNILISELKQPCIDLDKVVGTDRFCMSIMNNDMVVSAPNDSMTHYNNNIHLNTVIEDNVSVTVNVTYIQDLLKLSKINDTVEFEIGDDIPLSWNITSVDDCIRVSGLVAPILNQED